MRPAAHRGRGSSSSMKLPLPTWGSGSVEWQSSACARTWHATAARVESTRRRPSPKATPVFLIDARAWKRGRARTRGDADHPSPFSVNCRDGAEWGRFSVVATRTPPCSGQRRLPCGRHAVPWTCRRGSKRASLTRLQIERPWETPTRGRLRCRDPQVQKWGAYMALYVEREDQEKTAPHAHLVASRRAPPSISQPNRGHTNGHASVTPDDAAHGAARRHRSERERRL
jgi:hypothetical protein